MWQDLAVIRNFLIGVNQIEEFPAIRMSWIVLFEPAELLDIDAATYDFIHLNMGRLMLQFQNLILILDHEQLCIN